MAVSVAVEASVCPRVCVGWEFQIHQVQQEISASWACIGLHGLYVDCMSIQAFALGSALWPWLDSQLSACTCGPSQAPQALF